MPKGGVPGHLRLTETQYRRIAQCWEGGVPIKLIAERFGVSEPAITRRIKAMGLPLRHPVVRRTHART